MAIDNTPPDLAVELQKIYDSEINVRIGWFWDGGIDIRLGDDMNGYLADETVRTVAEIVPWLQQAIAYFYPGSSYARSLSRRSESAPNSDSSGRRRSAHR